MIPESLVAFYAVVFARIANELNLYVQFNSIIINVHHATWRH